MYKKLIVFELSDFEHFKIAILGYVCGHITFANTVICHFPGDLIEGWHNGFASKVEHHTTVGKFFDSLQSERNFNEILLEKMNVGQDVSNAKK